MAAMALTERGVPGVQLRLQDQLGNGIELEGPSGASAERCPMKWTVQLRTVDRSFPRRNDDLGGDKSTDPHVKSFS